MNNKERRRMIKEAGRSNLGFGVLVCILSAVLIALSTVLFIDVIREKSYADSGKAETNVAVDSVPLETPIPNANDRVMPSLDGEQITVKSAGELGTAIPDIFDAVTDSVIGVLNYQTQTFGKHQMLERYVNGTGFVVSSEGYILTNAHVVENAELVTVLLSNGEEVDAKVIGADEDTDVAVLKIETEGLKAIPVGNSDNVRVGEFVLAIGNPIDLERMANTLTFGIISGTKRSITIESHTNNYLQTDAAINYGNSGGPLLNMNGEVIGMNSAKSIMAGYDSFGNAVTAEGIGFALPINDVIDIMEKLVEYGTVERPAVGITVYTLTESSAAALDVVVGVYVESVVKDGPADNAGVKAGDVILKANGTEIKDQSELVNMIAELEIGDTIELTIYRDGNEIIIPVLLANKTAMNFNDTAESTEPAEPEFEEKKDEDIEEH